MSNKTYISAEDQLKWSFSLAKQIYDSGYRPTLILSLWRGGAPISLPIHEFFLHQGIQVKCIPLIAESYVGVANRKEVQIHNEGWVMDQLTQEDRLLVVDDIFDTGNTMAEVMAIFSDYVDQIKLATLFYRDRPESVQLKPDYFYQMTDRWVVFPHELEGLTDHEIVKKSTGSFDIPS